MWRSEPPPRLAARHRPLLCASDIEREPRNSLVTVAGLGRRIAAASERNTTSST